MIKQAEAFEVHGLKLNGKLTCGENIADLGGVKLALRALKKHLRDSAAEAPLINGFTPIQRFFLAWSQSWRENGKLYIDHVTIKLKYGADAIFQSIVSI